MTSPQIDPKQQLRVSDAEREAAADRLRAAVAEGRLTLDEGDERLAAAYAARTRAELDPLTADLPEPPAAPAPAQPLSERARWRLAIHAGIVAVLAVFLLVRWAVSEVWFFWPAWPLLWLSLSLVVHYSIARRRAR
jgi:Domain of unknown function (DUF1707)